MGLEAVRYVIFASIAFAMLHDEGDWNPDLKTFIASAASANKKSSQTSNFAN